MKKEIPNKNYGIFNKPHFQRTGAEIREFYLEGGWNDHIRDYFENLSDCELKQMFLEDYEIPKPKSIIYYDFDVKGWVMVVVGWFSGDVLMCDYNGNFENNGNAHYIMPPNTKGIFSLEEIKADILQWTEQMQREYESERIERLRGLREDKHYGVILNAAMGCKCDGCRQTLSESD